MNGLFGFLADVGNYDQRKVARYEEGDTIISTAFASDAGGYETAVRDPRWNGGDWVIVQPYDTRAEAESGHAEWVAMLTRPDAPRVLRDRSRSPIAEMIDDLGGDEWREKGPA